MAVIQENSRKKNTDSLVFETKMVEIGKLISIDQRSHVIYAHNYVRTFDFVPCKINSVFGTDHVTRITIYTLDFQ